MTKRFGLCWRNGTYYWDEAEARTLRPVRNESFCQRMPLALTPWSTVSAQMKCAAQ
jgi:hypothetical protein